MSDTPPTPNHAHASGSHYQPSLPVVLLIVVLFIAATFLMVRAVSPSTASSATTTTTTLATGGTKPPAIVKSAVSVQVSNGNGIAGDASHYTQLLTTQNWDTLPADNGPTVKSTVIYFHPGYQAAAQLIAKTIRVSSTSVRPLGRSKPVTGYASDDVIVILGPNSRP